MGLEAPAVDLLALTMPSSSHAKASKSAESSRDKVRAHRARLRKSGLRPVQIWVPDVRSRAFAAEAHRQSLAIARGPLAADDQAFVDAISEWGGE